MCVFIVYTYDMIYIYIYIYIYISVSIYIVCIVYNFLLMFCLIWSHLLKKSLLENFIFCAVLLPEKVNSSCKSSNDGEPLSST